MATKGKQLRFNLQRERERSYFSSDRRGRRVLEFSYVGTLLWTKLPGSWWPCTLTSSPAFLRSPRETFLSNSTEREKTGAGSNLGQTSSRTQASSSSWSRQTEMGGRETSCSVFHSACEKKKKKKIFFVQISVFVRGQKMSSGADPSAPGQDDGWSWTTKPSNKPAKPTNEMQNSFRRQPATRRRRPYYNPVG